MERSDNLPYFRELNANLNSLVGYEGFEYEQIVTPPTLKCRLKAHLPYWESIDANCFVIETIKSGYRILFIETPIRAQLANNKSALEHSEFVESAIRACSHGGEISRTPEISYPAKTTLSRVHMKIEWVIIPGLFKRAIHNNTWENCILNVQNSVRQEFCFISFLDIFSFWFCSISIKWISSCILCVFTFGICNFRHVASMCGYWSCALQSKLSRPPEISRCRAFTWIIVVRLTG